MEQKLWEKIINLIEIYGKDNASLAFYDGEHEYAIAAICIYSKNNLCYDLNNPMMGHCDKMMRTMVTKLMLCNEYDDNLDNVITIKL